MGRVAVWVLVLLLPAAAAAQEADPLERAWQLHHQADFEAALALLREAPRDLPAEERAQWLELEAVVRFALRDEGWKDVIVDLAMTAPDHRLGDRHHPEIRTAFALARASSLDPVETALARARARFSVADFSGSLEALDGVGPEAALTRAQRVERTVLEALVLFALQRHPACRDRLHDLAAIAPYYRFDERVPPSLRRLWEQVRRPRAAHPNG